MFVQQNLNVVSTRSRAGCYQMELSTKWRERQATSASVVLSGLVCLSLTEAWYSRVITELRTARRVEQWNLLVAFCMKDGQVTEYLKTEIKLKERETRDFHESDEQTSFELPYLFA